MVPERFGCCHGSDQACGVIAGFVRRAFGRASLRGVARIRKAALAAILGGATRAGSFADGDMAGAENAWGASGGHVHGGALPQLQANWWLRAPRVVLLRSSRWVVRSPRVMNASASLPFLKVFAFLLGGAVSPDPLDLDFGVAGAGPAERKERTAAGMLRAEKLSCLSVSHGACVAPIVVLLGAFFVVSEKHLFGDTDTFPFSPSLSLVDPALGRRCHVL